MNSLATVFEVFSFCYFEQGCRSPDMCLVGDVVLLLGINVEAELLV